MEGKPLEVRLLGQLWLGRDGRSLPAPRPKKGRLLVAHLVLSRRREWAREELAEHLWPDSDSDAAKFNLRQLLGTIRRESPILASYLLSPDRRTIGFSQEDLIVDVDEFKRLAPREPQAAVALYSGPLMEGLEDDWLRSARSELEELYLATLETLAARSGPRESVVWLRKALQVDPFRESTQQRVLVRLAEVGDIAGVQLAYRNFQELLRRELRCSPAHETRAIYRRLLASGSRTPQSPNRTCMASTNLPVPNTELFGRGDDIEALSKLLLRSRMVSLLGPGGVGKTRLSIAVGEIESRRRADGVSFVDLSSLTDGSRLPQTIGQAIGLAQPSGAEWMEQLATGLSAADRLLILDNCEHLIAPCANVVEQLLTRCGRLTILATSRAPLGVPGEQRFAVLPLALPAFGTELALGNRWPALELFEARAKLVKPLFALSSENVDLVMRICREVDAMPLGIEMAAARMAALPLVEVARRLDRKLSFLKSPSRSNVPRHQTLGAVVDWSYELLSEPAQALLRRLSVFSGGWCLEAAEAVCGFGILSVGCFETLLDLVEASLVQEQSGRYSLLETVRQYAEEQLLADPDGHETRDRHLDYMACLCADADRLIEGRGPDHVAELFRSELDNLRAALRWGIDSNAMSKVLQLAADGSVVFSTLQLDREAVAWLRTTLSIEKGNPASPERLRALRRAGKYYQSQHTDLDRATARQRTIATCQELAGLARQKDDMSTLAEALTNLGRVNLWWNRTAAKQALDESLTLCSTLPNQGRSQETLRLLGQWTYDAGSFDEALALFQEAGERAAHAGDVEERLFALQAVSHLHREHCRYDEALAGLVEVERILVRWPDSRASAFNDLRLAELHLDRWDFTSMIEPLSRAHRFFQRSGSRLHGLLTDGLMRYLAAHEDRLDDAANGISRAIGSLVGDAESHPSACWHGACIELEALSYCLAKAGHLTESATTFGGAQALRSRDWAYVSASVQARWSHLRAACRIGSFEAAIRAGAVYSPFEAVVYAESMERLLEHRLAG